MFDEIILVGISLNFVLLLKMIIQFRHLPMVVICEF